MKVKTLLDTRITTVTLGMIAGDQVNLPVGRDTDGKEKSDVDITTSVTIEMIFDNENKPIAILGIAGSGKSVWTLMLVDKILEKTVLPNTRYLFYIPLRNVDYKDKMSVLYFLTKYSSTEMDLSQTELSKANKSILKELNSSKEVTLVLDGWDEAVVSNLDKKIPAINYYDICSAEKIIRNILSKQIFRNAQVVISSRPDAFWKLNGEERPKSVYTLSGLSDGAQEELCKKICEDRTNDVLEVLKENEDIKALCETPVNAHLIMACIYIKLSKNEESLNATSITGILSFVLTRFMSESFVRKEERNVEAIEALSKVAYRGIKNRKFNFTRPYLQKHKVEDFQSFLSPVTLTKTSSFKILDGNKTYCFSHLTYQEFIATLRIAFFMESEEFQDISQDLSKPEWKIVLRFLYGLYTCGNIQMALPGVRMDPKKREFLVQLLKSEAKQQSSLLKVAGWAKESDDPTLTSYALEEMSDDIQLPSEFGPIDATNIAYLLKENKKRRFNLCLNSEQTRFRKKSLLILLASLRKLKEVCNKTYYY